MNKLLVSLLVIPLLALPALAWEPPIDPSARCQYADGTPAICRSATVEADALRLASKCRAAPSGAKIKAAIVSIQIGGNQSPYGNARALAADAALALGLNECADYIRWK
ncbi:MAG: hypothetical protein Q7R45_12025 [Sulfuricaulis sp.]|nr:hypothetical protein [Sulfuricaulis sp.]